MQKSAEPTSASCAADDAGGRKENICPNCCPEFQSAANSQAIPATNEFIVELGTSIGLPEMFPRLELPEFERGDVVTLEEQQTLPDDWFGYEGVDLVAIVGQAAVDKLQIDAAAIDALEHWVRLGGKLLIVVRRRGRSCVRQGFSAAALRAGRVGRRDHVAGHSARRDRKLRQHNHERVDANSLRVPQWQKVPISQVELSRAPAPPICRWSCARRWDSDR